MMLSAENVTTDESGSVVNTLTIITLTLFSAIIIIFGSLGNILNLIVLTSPAYKRNSHAAIVRVLSVLDLTVLWTVLLGYLIEGVRGFQLYTWYQDICSHAISVNFTLSSTINWIVSFIAIVRYTNIEYPFEAGKYFSFYRTIIYLLLIIVTNIVINQLLGKFRSPENAEVDFCGLARETQGISLLVRVLYMMNDTFIPAVLVTVFNNSVVDAHERSQAKRGELSEAFALMAFSMNQLEEKMAHAFSEVNFTHNATKASIDLEEDNTSLMFIPLVSGSSRDMILPFPSLQKIVSHSLSSSDDNANEPTRYEIEGRSVDPTTRQERMLLTKLFIEQTYLRKASLNLELTCRNEVEQGILPSQTFTLMPPRKITIPDVHGFVPLASGQAKCQCPLPALRFMLYLTTVLFIVLHLPFAIWFVLSPIIFNTSGKNLQYNRCVTTCCLVMNYSHHAINCLLYSIFSSKFQKEFRKMFTARGRFS